MTPLPTRPTRRGWCPGVRRPMATGDGLLVRVHPEGGALTAGQLRIVARAATAYGNGLLDISARGNLQIRGVTDETYPALLDRLDQAGLVEPDGEGPLRLTLVSPLAGIDPGEAFDSFALSAAVEAAAAGLRGLPAKVLVAIDGGGRFALDGIGADLHVVPARPEGFVAIGLASRSGTDWIGGAPLADVPVKVHSLLAEFVAMREAGRTEARRLRDLESGLAQEIVAIAHLGPAQPKAMRKSSPRAGAIALDNATALLAALPFGRCSAAQLVEAASWSERFGRGTVRLSATRGLLLPDIEESDIETLQALAREAGFIVDPGDPRLAVSACPGCPACTSGRTPASEHAAQLAALLADGTVLHVSGCAKGCAHSGRAALTLVGVEDGLYDVVLDGTTRDRAIARLTFETIKARLFRDGRGAFHEVAR